MRILIAEDDAKLARLLARGLREDGVFADVVHRGDEVLDRAIGEPYDAIILDVMLPGADGFEVCRRLRAAHVWSPVIMLTARDEPEHRVRGLNLGADDYVVKPFFFGELTARLRALSRRGPIERPTHLRVGDLSLDPAGRRAWRGETEIALSATELALLEAFMRHAGQTLSREQLLRPPRAGARTSSTCSSTTCARRSTGRSACARSKRFAAPGTDCVPTADEDDGGAFRRTGGLATTRRGDGRVTRPTLPLRWRITAAFTLASAALLLALAVFLHAELATKLDAGVNDGLRQRAGDLASLARASADAGLGSSRLIERGDDVAQVLTRSGAIVDAAPGFGDRPLLRPGQIQTAARRTVSVRERVRANDENDVAIIATPAGSRIAVVGTSLEARDEALTQLDGLLLLGIPATLLLAGAGGYVVSARALSPIERIRGRAAAITTGRLSDRIPIPSAHDEVRRLAETLNAMLTRLGAC